ncbi:MAG: DNA starvation/stationary phase protection protein Dps [Hyphomonadaceae bacterium]
MAKAPRVSSIDLPDNTRKAMIALLNARLADALDMKLLIKQAHWNVKGPRFIALHEMFDAMATRVDAQADEIAERATALGGLAIGTSQAVAKASTLEAYPTDVIEEKQHLELLAARFSAYGKNARDAIDQADDAGDKSTADLFTAISRQTDKDLWFIESHLA